MSAVNVGEVRIQSIDLIGIKARFDGALWVTARGAGYDICALIFRDHADDPDWEIGQSGISKLSIRRLGSREIVYNWDRGLDIEPRDQEVAQLVHLIERHLPGLCIKYFKQ